MGVTLDIGSVEGPKTDLEPTEAPYNFPQWGRPFRLGCAVPWPEDGTSYHRSMGPLWAMARQGGRPAQSGTSFLGAAVQDASRYPLLELIAPRKDAKGWQLTWDWVASCDAVLLQRPATAAYLQLAKLVKAMGRKLWVEWDDDYTCIPVSNASFSEYNAEDLRPRLKELCWLADVVTVATPELARRLPRVAEGNTVMIPNACMPVHRANGQPLPFMDDKREKRVSWRGTDTHDEDVGTILPALAELSRLPQFSKWLWHWSGGMPWQVHDAIPRERLEQSPFCGPVFFVPMLAVFAPFIHLAPLKLNRFNLCKSNLAWIEATCAGAVVVAPDSEEWQRPGVVNYTDWRDFRDKLRKLMEEWDGGKLHPNVALSRKFIEENLLLEKVNELRWGVIRTLMATSVAATCKKFNHR